MAPILVVLVCLPVSECIFTCAAGLGELLTNATGEPRIPHVILFAERKQIEPSQVVPTEDGRGGFIPRDTSRHAALCRTGCR